MLVMGRKDGESVIIADLIKVTVIKEANGQIRLGVHAPKEINIAREEVYKPVVSKTEAIAKLIQAYEHHFEGRECPT